MSRLYQLYQDHPSWFQYDAARSERLSRTQNAAYDLREKTVAPYLQFDAGLLNNRLHLVGGVRYERVMADARGLLTDNNAGYMKYADGTVVRSGDAISAGADGKFGTSDDVLAAPNHGTSTSVNYQLVNAPNVLPTYRGGSPIFLPEIQAAGNADRAAGFTTDSGTNLGRSSVPASRLVYIPKGASGHGMNDGYYPSLNASYNITENLIFQIGYAKTQARLDYNSVLIPGTSVSDDFVTSGLGAGAIGTISVHNTDLKPWTADNVDLRLTYYNKTGGYIGLGLFTKRVKNIIATYDTPPLTAADIAALDAAYPDLNLGPDAENYTLHTSVNAGNGRLDGAELELRQSLDHFLPRWAHGFRIYGSSTYSNPKGPQSDIFSNQAWRDKLNLSFSRRKFSANIGYTMNGEKIEDDLITSNGHSGQQVSVRQNLIEFNVTYSLTRWARLFAGATNITDERRAREQRYPGRPGYSTMTSSNTFGKTYTIGVTGSF
jgi:TonB-dependent receptor